MRVFTGWQTARGQGRRHDLHAAKPAARGQRDQTILDVADAFQARNQSCQTMNENIVTLDVREDLRQGREPFSKIMNAIAQLHSDETLLLVAPFEPAPLFSVLGKQGFDHKSKQIQSGDWEVLFTRSGEKPDAAITSAPVQRAVREVETKGGRWLEVDARKLEPPQPMVKILEALAGLACWCGIARPHGTPPDAPLRPTRRTRICR